MAIITLARQVAAKGDEVAQELASKLGYKFITRKQIEERILELGFRHQSFLNTMNESPDFSLLWQKTAMLTRIFHNMPCSKLPPKEIS